MKISIIATAIETKPTAKGSYQQLEVTYRDLDKNKVTSKKIMSFNKPESVFKTLSTAKGGDTFDIGNIKNEQSGYWDWNSAERATATTVETPSSKATASSATPAKGGWETPEERKARQVYIVRQSSLTNAVATLTHGRKTELKPEEVLELAKYYERFVFDIQDPQQVAQKDVDTFEDDLNDLPF